MENPIKMDDLGGIIIFGNTLISMKCWILVEHGNRKDTLWYWESDLEAGMVVFS